MATETSSRGNGTQATQQQVAVRPSGLGVPWDPFRQLAAMRQMMDALFNQPTIFSSDVVTELAPAVNLYEKDGAYVVEVAVPGYDKGDLKIEARGDQVLISGSYSRQQSDDKNAYHRREMRQGSFTRTIALPQDVDPNEVTAKLENGLLTITLQPTKTIESKTIPISD